MTGRARRALAAMVAVCAAFAAAACAVSEDGPVDASCSDECTLGQVTCQGAKLSSCEADAGGCARWEVTADCGAQGSACISTATGASCDCKDQCSAGDTRCEGPVIESCAAGSGCMVWKASTDCSKSGQTCDDAAGDATCIDGCDVCDTVGETRCSGESVQVCTLIAGCKSWMTTVDCAQNGQTCSSTNGSAACSGCAFKCAKQGLKICLNNWVNECKTQPSGCNDWVPLEDCALSGKVCKAVAGPSAQCQGNCKKPCSPLGATQCDANTIAICKQDPNGCLEWTADTTCPLGQTCDASGGAPVCVTAPATGEDCGTALPVVAGQNVLAWTATKNDYLTTKPSCSTSNTTGPDVVLAYAAGFTGTLQFSLEKLPYHRWVILAASQCGAVGAPLACLADYNASTETAGEFSVTSGGNYYFHLVDTTTGSMPLGNPLKLTLTEIDCSVFVATPLSVSPQNGSTTTTLSPSLTVNFDAAIKTNAGVLKLSGDKGTNISYDLAAAPTQVSFSNGNKTLSVQPAAFPAGEQITVTWTGIVDAKCGSPVAAANWSFTVITPPCAPGVGGMVGTSTSSVSTGLGAFAEAYVVADESPSGWIYLGGATDLYRVPKAGGSLQYVNSLAGLSSMHLGYNMLAHGSDLFSIESKTTGTSGHLWRLSKDAGQSWSVENFASFATQPSDKFHAAASDGSKIYLLTNETSSLVATEIWSVPAKPTSLPSPATLEASFTGETYCGGLALDDDNFYVACGTGDRLVRVDRTSSAVTLISNAYDLSTTSNALYADDADGDGSADFLYFKGGTKQVLFVCDPGSTAPYADQLIGFGIGTATFGLGFDAKGKSLYALDDTTGEMLVVK